MAKTPKKPKTARQQRREKRRRLVKDVRKRERLNSVTIGGKPGLAIEISTPVVIDGIIRTMRCHQCRGELEKAELTAESTPSGLRRVASTRCKLCHAPRQIWFAVGPTVN